MKKFFCVFIMSILLFSCNNKKEISIPDDKTKLIQDNSNFINEDFSNYFDLSIKSKFNDDKYYYSFVANNAKDKLSKIKFILLDKDNNGYIVSFGYDNDYDLITGNKKLSKTKIPGISIHFTYSFEAYDFKVYSSFNINNEEKEVKTIIHTKK